MITVVYTEHGVTSQIYVVYYILFISVMLLSAVVAILNIEQHFFTVNILLFSWIKGLVQS